MLSGKWLPFCLSLNVLINQMAKSFQLHKHEHSPFTATYIHTGEFGYHGFRKWFLT